MMSGLDHPENSDSVWISRDMEQSYAQPSLDLHGQAVVDPVSARAVSRPRRSRRTERGVSMHSVLLPARPR